MIYVLFDEMTKSTIENPKLYFDNSYDEEWFSDSLVRDIIYDIDKSEVLDDCIRGPLGVLPYERLSTTTKALILYLKEDDYFETDAIYMGANACKWFVEISKRKDVYLTVCGYHFDMASCTDFDFCCVNDKTQYNGSEWVAKMLEFMHSGVWIEPRYTSVMEAVS